MAEENPFFHLEQAKLRRLVHLGSETPLEEMEPEDAEVCRQLGLFFAFNPHLANYAIDIECLTLIPQDQEGGAGLVPQAVVTIVHKKRRYRLQTDERGILPPLPFGKQARRKKRKRRWR